MATVDQSLPQSLSGFSIAGLTPNAAYNKINTEILRWENHVRCLKALQTSIAPISRLPAEVLSQIMDWSYRLSKNPHRTRLYLTWVCRYWRDVALGDPQLWRKTQNYPEEIEDPTQASIFVQECFARSRSLDLEISLRSPSRGLLELCMSRIHRIRSLAYIPCITRDTTYPPNQFWSRPAPHLSSLSLTKTSLSNKPFNGVCPKLTRLRLEECTFDWSFPLSATTLTSLHIAFPKNTISIRLLVRSRGLSKMPSLINLYLKNCLTNTTTPTPTYYNLPSLRNLYLEDGQDQVLGFLQSIKTPEICSLQACIHANRSFGESQLLTTIDSFKRLHPSLWLDIRHLTMRPVAIEVEDSSSLSKDSIIIPGPLFTTLALSLCNHLSIDHLETLSIEPRSREMTGVTGALRSLRTVQHIRVRTIGHDLQGLLVQKQDLENIPLPSLMEIHCDAPSETLYSILELRRDILQRKLPKLTFRECEPEEMKVYEEVAHSVSADGVVGVEDLREYLATLQAGLPW
ncbi:hypothetical protein BDN72DRAFT_837871 [Pluteus cervinus]|uniref:Uncharacterized protein n=1 Tax=Pluteus cervinus TaxID=181527 RepID=A0ACD3B0Z3_9AGAR|nr:hypothetical protein BDN72DRAFT_837871 [Pluteus cervinus]